MREADQIEPSSSKPLQASRSPACETQRYARLFGLASQQPSKKALGQPEEEYERIGYSLQDLARVNG